MQIWKPIRHFIIFYVAKTEKLSTTFSKKADRLLELRSSFVILKSTLSFTEASGYTEASGFPGALGKDGIYIMKEPVQLCYTISEAAKLMNVEPHVLRYWEDELNLNIARNSMGHRIYTDDDLKTFKSIQHLKASHISLKDIREQLPSAPSAAVSPAGNTSVKSSGPNGNADKMTQFKSILTTIIKDAMSENSRELSDNISSKVSDDVRKEIDFLVRQREEDDEARFKKLDETIRTFQKARQEAAITKVTENKGKKKRFFNKNK